MVKTLAILIITVVIAMFDVPSMWKNKQKKELVVYSVLLFIGSTCLILLAVGVKIPSPVDLFSKTEKLFQSIFQIN
ncbi:hypothetical protein SAMN05421670_0722 [Psychrobacillus psychrotolerans]|uniref:Uncharacterized protein n=1 Tax=Psychrobacillus psychrotolerans TaxID=126156 RepID=A0A1I5V9U8_9BACI|nr:hypothetical protein [Psychrobacillus psychrotolerans]SFQ04107.1 hypothetical protein SAMN05421670_0722 [Psychrobacillus psychrotolerans]